MEKSVDGEKRVTNVISSQHPAMHPSYVPLPLGLRVTWWLLCHLVTLIRLVPWHPLFHPPPLLGLCPPLRLAAECQPQRVQLLALARRYGER
jgi:hypothetical protein